MCTDASVCTALVFQWCRMPRTGACVQYDDEAHASVLHALSRCQVVAKIGNFGSAVCVQRDGVRTAAAAAARCMAPEVAQGKRLHQASDVYSFGVIMWELITGHSTCAWATAQTATRNEQHCLCDICWPWTCFHG
jgi:Protein tyrosine and serine/threonine kinase